MHNEISFADFEKVEIHVGKILDPKINERAILPAYILTIDFGSELGIKTSSAQITRNYTIDDLKSRKICAVTNFSVKFIAG